MLNQTFRFIEKFTVVHAPHYGKKYIKYGVINTINL